MSDHLATVHVMQSEQARQRKRERRRLERAKKRRSKQAALPDEIDIVFEWRSLPAPKTDAQMCAPEGARDA